MKKNVAELIVRFLKDTGVRYLFGLTGHSIFPITDAVYSEPGVEFVPVMHELSAAYMACSYAKGTRSFGVCTASAGAGVTNLLTGIAYAHKESIPVIVLASDVARQHAGKGASSWHEIPQQEMFRPVTKFSLTLESGESVAEVLREAVRQATTGRKGPVYLAFPRNVQVQEVEVPEPLWADKPAPPLEPAPVALDRAAEMLSDASAPVLIAGGGVYWARAEAELKELAESLSIPFGTSPSHKGLLSEQHPLALGVLGFGAFPFANEVCLQSDLILAVGTTFSEGLTLGYGNKVVPAEAKIVQIDTDSGELGKIYPVDLPILGDAKAALRGLIDRARNIGAGKTNSARMEKLRQGKEAWHKKLFGHGYGASAPIDQWQVYRALMEALGEDAVVVGAGGTAEAIRRFVAPSYLYHSGDMRAIGFGLSTSIGLKLAFPSRPLVCVTGDGSFMLENQELATIASRNLPIVTLVIRNDAYGNMKRDQIKHYGGRVIGTELPLPDLCALAAAYGIEAKKVEQPPALLPEVRRALELNRPVLLDVVCPIEGI